MINCCVVLCWSLFVVTFHVLVLQWLFTLNWLQTFMLSYFGHPWDETYAQPLVMQILRSCSPVSKEAVSPAQPNEYRGQCHRNQTVGRKKIQPRLTPNKWKSTHEGCMNEMRQNKETWKDIWESWENHLAKAFGTVSSRMGWEKIASQGRKLPRQITQERLSMDICQSNDGCWKRKMPLKHCYLEYLAIFFRTITHSYLHVLYQDQLYQPTEAISLESQPIQRQTLGGSSFCPSLAGTKVFRMKLTWKWFLGDSFWTPRHF